MILIKELTKGEVFRIARRRNGFTQQDVAISLSVPEKHVAEWESGDRDVPHARAPLGRLTPGEACYIARWRAQMTVQATAKALGVSRITLLKMEGDKTGSTGDLVAFWEARNWGSDPDAPKRSHKKKTNAEE